MSAVLFSECFGYCGDCFFLIVSSGNGFVDGDVFESGFLRVFVVFFPEIGFCVDAGDRTFGVVLIVPDAGIKTVGEEDDWSDTELNGIFRLLRLSGGNLGTAGVDCRMREVLCFECFWYLLRERLKALGGWVVCFS
ncbi:hypothetical protein O0S10_02350 [Methanocorpusculum sp. MG]|uniref:Uncharacterized protein n=1 Tax=Methanocorpusculum petauri TaxID=3002863 RepID=A0ABT4IFU7_9EURY|nr:hypothetical protein [Methanocorpusculum petauri]MCZ0860070.1 hypothetical protein [Methanocorpusculum petauri]